MYCIEMYIIIETYLECIGLIWEFWATNPCWVFYHKRKVGTWTWCVKTQGPPFLLIWFPGLPTLKPTGGGRVLVVGQCGNVRFFAVQCFLATGASGARVLTLSNHVTDVCVCVCYCTLIPPFGIDPLHPIVSHPIDCLFQRDTTSSQSTVYNYLYLAKDQHRPKGLEGAEVLIQLLALETCLSCLVNLLSLLAIAHVKIECWWILINMYLWPSEYSKIIMNDWTVLNLRMAKFRKESWFG